MIKLCKKDIRFKNLTLVEINGLTGVMDSRKKVYILAAEEDEDYYVGKKFRNTIFDFAWEYFPDNDIGRLNKLRDININTHQIENINKISSFKKREDIKFKNGELYLCIEPVSVNPDIIEIINGKVFIRDGEFKWNKITNLKTFSNCIFLKIV